METIEEFFRAKLKNANEINETQAKRIGYLEEALIKIYELPANSDLAGQIAHEALVGE